MQLNILYSSSRLGFHKNYVVPDISNAKVEKSWSRAKSNRQTQGIPFFLLSFSHNTDHLFSRGLNPTFWVFSLGIK